MDNPLKDFSGFVKGECVNCGEPATLGALCFQCYIDNPVPGKTSAITATSKAGDHDLVPSSGRKSYRLMDMTSGEEGYTEPYTLFEVDSKLYIITSASFTFGPDNYKTLRIRKWHEIFEVDGASLDRDDIFLGWPAPPDQLDYQAAKIV